LALLKATLKLTANFESNHVSIDAFWSDRKAPQAFIQLLEDLDAVIDNPERIPSWGDAFWTAHLNRWKPVNAFPT
jgi:hypothetical protein